MFNKMLIRIRFHGFADIESEFKEDNNHSVEAKSLFVILQWITIINYSLRIYFDEIIKVDERTNTLFTSAVNYCTKKKIY